MRIFVLVFLCSFAAKASSPGRADCYELAARTGYTSEESSLLCANAVNAGPVQCSLEVDLTSSFTKDESIRLCRPPYGNENTVRCALESVNDDTHEQLIRRCRKSDC